MMCLALKWKYDMKIWYEKTEERFNTSGQLLWDRRELKRPRAPDLWCSDVNNTKDHRREKNEIVPSNGLQTRYFAAYYSKI